MSRSEPNSRILAIVPAYNEEQNLPEVIRTLKQDAPYCDILVVDDGSSDSTYEVAGKLGVTALRLPVNLGIGGAVQTGLRYAHIHGYDVAVQVDSDGQHVPAEIIRIVKPLSDSGVDMVIGSRYLENTGYRTPLMRKLGMVFFSIFTSFIIGQKITDTTSGFRALNRKSLVFLSRNYPVDFPDAEVLVMIHRQGLKMLEVPVKMNQRFSGKSSTTSLKSLYYPFKACLAIIAVLMQEKGRT